MNEEYRYYSIILYWWKHTKINQIKVVGAQLFTKLICNDHLFLNTSIMCSISILRKVCLTTIASFVICVSIVPREYFDFYHLNKLVAIKYLSVIRVVSKSNSLSFHSYMKCINSLSSLYYCVHFRALFSVHCPDFDYLVYPHYLCMSTSNLWGIEMFYKITVQSGFFFVKISTASSKLIPL